MEDTPHLRKRFSKQSSLLLQREPEERKTPFMGKSGRAGLAAILIGQPTAFA